ncbi:MAG: ComF family protein [Clostridia bacterium]|nr:ComF family protein [Clostridia bacterium]
MISCKVYRCCGCGRATDAKDARYIYKKSCICRACFAGIRSVEGSKRFFGDYYKDYTYSPFYYDGVFRHIFLSFKFNGNLAFGHLLGMATGESLSDINELHCYDAIVPIPLSRERLNERGYNQSLIIAEYISRAIDVPVIELLKRTVNTPAQSISVGTSRTRNLIGAFKAASDTASKRVILFDDIHTTGSTLNAGMVALKNAGAADVCYVTAAYVYSD